MSAKKENSEIYNKELELQLRNSEMFQKIIEKGMPILEKYLDSQITKVDAPKIKYSIFGLIMVLFGTLCLTGFLLYKGKLDSGSFTFLLGTILGASITFFGNLVDNKR